MVGVADFSDYSQWNGKGSIIPAERVKLEKIIDRAHGWGKPVRFWDLLDRMTDGKAQALRAELRKYQTKING